jgi:hypothetical protein
VPGRETLESLCSSKRLLQQFPSNSTASPSLSSAKRERPCCTSLARVCPSFQGSSMASERRRTFPKWMCPHTRNCKSSPTTPIQCRDHIYTAAHVISGSKQDTQPRSITHKANKKHHTAQVYNATSKLKQDKTTELNDIYFHKRAKTSSRLANSITDSSSRWRKQKATYVQLSMNSASANAVQIYSLCIDKEKARLRLAQKRSGTLLCLGHVADQASPPRRKTEHPTVSWPCGGSGRRHGCCIEFVSKC